MNNIIIMLLGIFLVLAIGVGWLGLIFGRLKRISDSLERAENISNIDAAHKLYSLRANSSWKPE